MFVQRQTIKSNVSITGIGLHSGIYTTVELHPAPAGSGITFVRADLQGLRIPALQASTTALDHATTVGKDDVQVGTVEHLLSALMACGITDVDIHIDGPEVPIIDGSALPFMHLIDAAGVRGLGTELPVLRLRQPIELIEGDKSIRMTPSNRLVIKYKIDFNHPAIGRESFQFDFGHDSFLKKIAPARTFGFMRDVEKLRAVGLARGGSVENAVVLDDRGVVNGPLRFKDEFVRHKILDLIGDLALIGRPVAGEITAYKAGHAMHSRFVAKILEAAATQHDTHDVAMPVRRYESFA
ncbi:MAG: UDP-3-O-[3-hydroxymyristoyl] N-acetylglucosamine deacetylase [Acidobacteriota bacterium]|jgi:UDP-3-O-[3-hydroxymyristoyl] N-acetylglucosamine deacetylase|nr:UDP-3-O-[3-hydroxymyristoyl] N-acetylglucosamine deacetylase [Acidobacteriota bacterium]